MRHSLRSFLAGGLASLACLLASTSSAHASSLYVPSYWNAAGLEDAPCAVVACQSGLSCALDDLRNTRTCTNPWTRGVEMMWMSEAAYWDDSTRAQRNACIGQWGYSEYGYYYGDGVFEDAEALVAQRSDRIVVAFSGTALGQGDVLLTDFNSEITFPYADDIDGWPFPGTQGWLGVEVHEGFLEYVLSVWPQVSAAVKTLNASKPRPIFITGHSLGGAAAMLFAAMLREDMVRRGLPNELHVVTFGSPKVGDLDWVDKYQRDARLENRTERWVNYRDLIVESPVRDFYQHAGRRIHVDHAGCSDDDPACWTIEYDAPEYDYNANISDFKYHALKHYEDMFDGNVPAQLSSVLSKRCSEP